MKDLNEIKEMVEYSVKQAKEKGKDDFAEELENIDSDELFDRDYWEELREKYPEAKELIDSAEAGVEALADEQRFDEEESSGLSIETDKFSLELRNFKDTSKGYRADLVCKPENGTKVPEENVKLSKRGIENFCNTVNQVSGLDEETFQELLQEIYKLKNAAMDSDEDQNGKQNEKETLKDRYDEATIDKANDLLENGDILKKVKSVLDHEIAGEHRNKMGLFLQLFSKDTDSPLMIFGVQKQGEGKSYVAKNIINLFPDESVKNLTNMTPAALYRRAQEDPTFFDNKIVFFGEIPENEDNRDVFQIFRQLVSEGEVAKELVIEVNGELQPVELRLEGSPVVISTTVNPELIDKQDMSRGLVYGPEMGEAQNERVREFQRRSDELPESVTAPEKIEETKQVIRCAIEIVSEEEIRILNPFTREIDEVVPTDLPNVKREFPKILSITSKLPARLYHRQRPKLKAGGEEYTLVTWKDVMRGLTINKNFIDSIASGLSDSTIDALKEINKHVNAVEESLDDIKRKDIDFSKYKSFTSKNLAGWMNIATKTARGHLRTLDQKNLIYKDDEGKTHQHYLLAEEVGEGIVTLSKLETILKSVIGQEKLLAWAEKYIEETGIDKDADELIEQVGLTREMLPVEINLGLKPDEELPTPVYMENIKDDEKLLEELIVRKKGDNIVFRFESVGEEFMTNSEEEKMNAMGTPPGGDSED